MQLVITNARLAFGDAIYTKSSYNGGEEKFSCKLILDPSTKSGAKQISQIEASIAKMAKSELKLAKLPAAKSCLCDGDEKTWDGFAGMMFISASNKHRPQVVNRSQQPVAQDDLEEAPYSGCTVTAVINLWAQNNNWGKRINASLEVVQFVKDGERFGAGGTPVDLSVLPDLEDEDDDLD